VAQPGRPDEKLRHTTTYPDDFRPQQRVAFLKAKYIYSTAPAAAVGNSSECSRTNHNNGRYDLGYTTQNLSKDAKLVTTIWGIFFNKNKADKTSFSVY
jgi:hypothetical protein